MSTRINQRERIILNHAWVITKEEKSKLDHFFLVLDTWSNLSPDLYSDDQEHKLFLRHDGKEYEVVLLNPVRMLSAAKQIGLSFRVHRATNLRVVLIREWFEEQQRPVEEEVIK